MSSFPRWPPLCRSAAAAAAGLLHVAPRPRGAPQQLRRQGQRQQTPSRHSAMTRARQRRERQPPGAAPAAVRAPPPARPAAQCQLAAAPAPAPRAAQAQAVPQAPSYRAAPGRLAGCWAARQLTLPPRPVGAGWVGAMPTFTTIRPPVSAAGVGRLMGFPARRPAASGTQLDQLELEKRYDLLLRQQNAL